MPNLLHQENFIAIRTISPEMIWHDPGFPGVESDYRNLLSAANESFFHREYTIALDQYLSLREKVLQQSHPELPNVGGITWEHVYDAHMIEPDRLFEMSRRLLTRIEPGSPITVPSDVTLFTTDEVKPNETLAALTGIGVDPGVATQIGLAEAQ